ncbi:hypothetical protein H2509_20205 [Stappia sp. F7233]|uniref:Uncharacterized protein n=1 Tax=Stappia albiluteola TaxID=2758565 RepID=A0A839AIA4_9HYPH|nr:hypothetical protein [Stappia albiluteola]MBA5779461.1 hypothetical protein [Stappia albiluteola]
MSADLATAAAIGKAVSLPEADGEEGWARIVARARHLDGPLPARLSDMPWGVSYVLVPDLATARELLGPRSDALRRRRGKVFFESRTYRLRNRLRLGMHDRGEAYAFADLPLEERDGEGQARHLPLHLKVIRLKALRLAPGQILDITSHHGTWPGLHFREELYVALVVDRVIAGPGSAIEVRGNVAVIDIGRLELPAGGEAGIRILGTDHPAFSSARTFEAKKGRDGLPGMDGAAGRPPTVRASFLGPQLADPGAPDGHAGAPGEAGAAGTDGQNGGLAMLADIRIAALQGLRPGGLCIVGAAGAGRPGGAGGGGGAGGKGGDAAAVPQGLDMAQGVPGPGGRGGDGGAGGRGGSGGLGSNIFVTAPRQFHGSIALQSQPGRGGPGGRGGAAGPGGAGGRDHAGVSSGLTGQAGTAGADGSNGKTREGPPMWVFAPDSDDS